MRPAVLHVLGGLPGCGKSTLARALAGRVGAVWLRVDTIEQSIRDAGGTFVGPEGYLVAAAVARDNLADGRDVVVDAVNPLPVTREGFREAARSAGARLHEIEVHCSDPAEHRRRVEHRLAEVPGLRLPTWDEVVAREFVPWPEARRLDTSARSAEESLEDLVELLAIG